MGMNGNYYINSDIGLPIYKQVVSQIEQKIISGEYAPGFLLPSMNELSAELDISKETIKKAYSILRDKGVIEPRQGKGFYVCKVGDDRRARILLLFDKFSSNKQVLYNSFMSEIGEHAEVTIRIHNQSLDVFELFIDEALDNYDYYVVAPHFPLDQSSQKRMLRLLKRLPNRKLILVDRNVPELSGNYGVVYQDFENDITDCLSAVSSELKKFARLNVITLSSSLYGSIISASVGKFCTANGINVEFSNDISRDNLRRNEVYLILSSQLETGLLSLARNARELGLEIGKDVSVISYNDFPLNEIIFNGLTAASTDFEQMGRIAAQMIMEKTPDKVRCPFNLIRRGTF